VGRKYRHDEHIGSNLRDRGTYNEHNPGWVGKYNLSTYSLPTLHQMFQDPAIDFDTKWDKYILFGYRVLANPSLTPGFVRITPDLIDTLKEVHPIEAAKKRIGLFAMQAAQRRRELSDHVATS
jgi:hypothetical protein